MEIYLQHFTDNNFGTLITGLLILKSWPFKRNSLGTESTVISNLELIFRFLLAIFFNILSYLCHSF